MDTGSLRTTLEALSAEASSLESRVAAWRREVEVAEQRLVHIRGAVQNLKFILGDSPEAMPIVNVSGEQVWPDITVADSGAPIEEAPQPDAAQQSENENPVEDTEERDEEAHRPAPRIKRTRSTEWIAEIVNSTGRVMSRDEVYAEYERQKGIPETWTSPRNSLGNALGRAVANKWVKRLPGDRFVGADVDLFAEPIAEEDRDG